MHDRAEYVIHARLKNNLLLSRILERASSVAAFCTEYGFTPGEIGALVNLKRSALLKRDRDWRPTALKLADILGVLPDELFSEEQQNLQLKTNSVLIEVTREQARLAMNGAEVFERRELLDKIFAKAKLNKNQAKVLRLRYNDDATLDECGRALGGKSRERVRQIEAGALRKMRYASDKLNAFGEQHEYEPKPDGDIKWTIHEPPPPPPREPFVAPETHVGGWELTDDGRIVAVPEIPFEELCKLLLQGDVPK